MRRENIYREENVFMKSKVLRRRVLLVSLVMTLLLSTVLVLGGCGCSKDNSNIESSNASETSSLQKKLDIKDFVWNVGQGKKNGKDVYVFNLTNNSKYDLLGVDIKYKTKSGLTPEQLSVFDGFMSKHASYIKEGQTTADVNLQGKDEAYVPSKGAVENVLVALGIGDSSWRESPTTQQFDLMEPSELQLAVVDGDILYFAYYDFTSQTWKIDSKTVELNKWPSSEIGKIIPKIEGHVFRSMSYDSIGTIDIDVYNVTTEEYNEYVSKLKSNGFTEEIKENDYSSSLTWEAKDKDGNSVKLDYKKEKKQLDIDATGKKTEK